MDLNSKAAKVLNDRGCIIFHQAQKNLEKKLEKLTQVDDGIREIFRSGEFTYCTTETSCNCAFAQNHTAPCAHILFLRSQSD